MTFQHQSLSCKSFNITSSLSNYDTRKSKTRLVIGILVTICFIVIGIINDNQGTFDLVGTRRGLSLLPNDDEYNNNNTDQEMTQNLRLLNSFDIPSNNRSSSILTNKLLSYTTNWTSVTNPDNITDILSGEELNNNLKNNNKNSKYSMSHCPQVSTTQSVLPPFTGKKGIGKPFAPGYHHYSWRVNLPRVIELDVYWNYNWALYRIDDQPDNIEFIPMSWGGYDTSITLNKHINTLVIPTIVNGTGTGTGTGPQRFLGFNEPDHPQSSMTVYEALDRWPILESLNIPLVSPSCAHPDGIWMEEFMGNATEKCLKIDYLGVHWYGKANVTRFKNDMIGLYNKFHLPIVITEFSPARFEAKRNKQNPNSPSDVLSFMKAVLPWLEQQSFIVAYAWFSFLPDNPTGWSSSLYDAYGNMTAIGRYYKSVRSDNIYGDQSIQPDNVTSW
jgi:Glycosyl hydrolase catalytic core